MIMNGGKDNRPQIQDRHYRISGCTQKHRHIEFATIESLNKHYFFYQNTLLSLT